MYIYNSIVLLLWHKITENWLTLLRAYLIHLLLEQMETQKKKKNVVVDSVDSTIEVYHNLLQNVKGIHFGIISTVFLTIF